MLNVTFMVLNSKKITIILLHVHRVKLEDHSKLTDVGICNNTQMLLIVTTPFELYVQDMNGRQHTIIVPSSEPEVFFL